MNNTLDAMQCDVCKEHFSFGIPMNQWAKDGKPVLTMCRGCPALAELKVG